MTGVLTVANWALPLLYLALLVDYGVSFFLRVKTRARSRWLVPVVLVHALFLVVRSVVSGHPPLASNYEILSVVAVSMAAVYAAVEFGVGDRRTGAFVLLLVFLFQYTSSLFASPSGAPASAGQPAGEAGWTGLHVVPAILAYTGFSIAAVYGLLHLTAQRNLKKRRFGALFDRLPSLDLLGKMSWYALLVGFVLITLTIVTAATLAMAGRLGPAGQASFWNPKVAIKAAMGSAAWLIYAIAVLGKYVGKWPASRVSGIAVNGYIALIVLFVISAALS